MNILVEIENKYGLFPMHYLYLIIDYLDNYYISRFIVNINFFVIQYASSELKNKKR
jgi:hypothetical protein